MTPIMLDVTTPIGVLGAGAMGAGIAQVAAAAGHPVVVADARREAVARARDTMRKAFAREVEKGRLAPDAAVAHLERVLFSGVDGDTDVTGPDLEAFAACGLVIEAVVEDIEIKCGAFRAIEAAVSDACILATNTSSLAVTAIAAACRRPSRVVGVHFFNPAPVLPLVEIVPALQTDASVVRAARDLVVAWGKTPVVARDTPGFIVNRVARPFYGEALRILEEGLADVATIDWAMRDLGGFRMGPFELMDFIGHDVNYAVTSTVFEATYWDPRYRPSITQKRLVDAGFLGRKSGRGFYDYSENATRPEPRRDDTIGRKIVDRVLSLLVNEAAEALLLGVASADDLELAMTKGVNYPRGLLAWGEEIGLDRILATLESLHAEYGDDRYRPSALLRRVVREGRGFRTHAPHER